MGKKFRNYDKKKDIDLIGIGNAIVDIVVNVNEEFLEKNNLKKGSMTLISSEESAKLLKDCEVIKKVSGGSSANTVVSLAQLGNKVQFIGRVKNDYFGNYFSSNIKKSNTIFNTPPIEKGPPSAHSIIFISPDAQRTMCTYLGASVNFEPNDVNFNLIKNSRYLYLEGYLWDNDLAKNAFLESSKIAKTSGTKVILSLSDSFCVDRHRESFLELIEKYVDILFCNESEVLSLLKSNNLENCKSAISSLCKLVIITLGGKGSLIMHKGEIQEIKPVFLGEIIDTTGAGDIYAGGFIHGLINEYPIKKCGDIGSLCASHIITQLGSRSKIDLQDLIEKNLS